MNFDLLSAINLLELKPMEKIGVAYSFADLCKHSSNPSLVESELKILAMRNKVELFYTDDDVLYAFRLIV